MEENVVNDVVEEVVPNVVEKIVEVPVQTGPSSVLVVAVTAAVTLIGVGLVSLGVKKLAPAVKKAFVKEPAKESKEETTTSEESEDEE